MNIEKTMRTIHGITCNFLGVDYMKTFRKSRKPTLVHPRYYTISIMRELYPKVSLDRIGSAIFWYDHAGVLHAIKRINNLKDTEPEARKRYKAIISASKKSLDYGVRYRPKEDIINDIKKEIYKAKMPHLSANVNGLLKELLV